MKKSNKKRQLQLVSFCILPMLFLLVFHYFPMTGILIAFKDYKYNLGIRGSEWIGLQNFETLFLSGSEKNILVNTVFLNGAILLGETLVSLLIALALYGLNSRRAARRYQAALLLPGLVSWVAAGYLIYAFLNPSYGVFSRLQVALDLDVTYWYSEPRYWPLILVVSAVWKNAGFGSMIYYLVLAGNSGDSLEAAQLEGAGGLQKLRHVILPSLQPVLTAFLLYRIGGIFKSDFDQFYQLTRELSILSSTTKVFDTSIYEMMRIQGNMGVAAAFGLVQSLAGLVLVLVLYRLVKRCRGERSLF